MWANKISLFEFRAFEKPFEMDLAKNITCISGHNGIGKSTILAVLSNCGELKKSIATQLNGSTFRGEFSDIIIGDEHFDSIGDKAEISFSEIPSNGFQTDSSAYVPKLLFRSTFQKINGHKRYRLLPKKILGIRNSEAKLSWPTIYLGLSRLYPVGESEIATSKRLPTDIMDELLSIHQELLGMQYDDEARMESIGLKEISRKKKTGVKTSTYSSTSNSAGQDNVGQLILAVLSFKNLKSTLLQDYHGGILLIDEIDATLHPAVQFRLFDYLLKQSKELDLQILFTTHSITLLEHISKQYNKKGYDVKTCYLQKRTSGIHIKENPTPLLLRHDLSDTYSSFSRPQEKIKLLTEDEVARWFFKYIIKYLGKESDFDFEILDIDIGWQHIIKLMLADSQTFNNYIALLDPDVRNTDNEKWLIDKTRGTLLSEHDTPNSSIFRLPASENSVENIEKMIWIYISTLPDDSDFYKHEFIEENNWQKHIVLSHGPNSDDYSHIKNESFKFKAWFNDNKIFIEIAIHYWVKDNHEVVDTFINNLYTAYKYKLSKTQN